MVGLSNSNKSDKYKLKYFSMRFTLVLLVITLWVRVVPMAGAKPAGTKDFLAPKFHLGAFPALAKFHFALTSASPKGWDRP